MRKSVAISLDLMFPKAKNGPALRLEMKSYLCVTFSVAFKLSVPKAGIRFRPDPVRRTTMPLAAVDKYSDPSRHKNHIRFPDYLGFYTVPKAQPPQRSPQEKLWLRVLTLDP